MKFSDKAMDVLSLISKEKLAKALAVAIFRNGEIENIHADASKNVTDADMKILNKGVCNRIYEFLEILESGDTVTLIESLDFAYRCTYNWDSPENKHEL